MATKRLFFALELSDEALDHLENLQNAFRECVPEGSRLRWTPRENMHLTLKFLGSTETSLVSEFGHIMDELVTELSPFTMTLDDIGAFPHPRQPRILWTGVDDASAETLTTLHRRLESALDDYPVEPDDHPFKAHVTFGRVKSNRAFNLNDLLSDVPDGPFGETTVESVVLYESELSHEGSTHTPLHRSRLAE